MNPGHRWSTVMIAIAWTIAPAAAQDLPDGYVGNETCAVCHEDTVAAHEGSIHARAVGETSCEGCHGPGEQHVDEGDPTWIRAFPEDGDPHEVTETCLECHARTASVRSWSRAEHARQGVACLDCHQVHEGRDALPALLRSSTPKACYGCHTDIRAQFALPERHPVDGAAMDCVDCHNPHGPSPRTTLGGFKQGQCLRCHSEYRGPWFFEHEAVAVEGCAACHAPHGSINRHLLTYQRVGDLCMQCHPNQPFFHVAVDGSGERTTGINDCTRCHTEIHGSNNDALFLN